MLSEVHFIATPIGNLDDISLRALKIFKASEVILVEEYRIAKKLLEQLNIDLSEKEIIEINEHNERKKAQTILDTLITNYSKVCLISDCGMPAIADSGHRFLKHCLEYGIDVKYVPGASSILGGLLVSGIVAQPFYYAGFLPRKDHERKQALMTLKRIKAAIIIMDTPYRLSSLLKSLKQVFGKTYKLSLAFNLTMKDEKNFQGTIEEAFFAFGEQKNKKNFVLVLDNHGSERNSPSSYSSRKG